MNIRAVVWDVDDTLFDYTTADRMGMRAHLVAEGLLDRFGSVEQAIVHWREITDAQWARFGAGETTFQGQRRDRVRVFLGEELSDAEADAWFERYIGDHPEIDGRGAADAGLLSVWIDRGGAYAAVEPPVGPRRIASLAELPAILGADTRFGAPSTFG
jgi:FMN phosphatase YigB (HAD superfamily)